MARVEFAYPYTGADGKEYKPDQTADVDPGVAADLIAKGLARKAAPTPADIAKRDRTQKES